MDVEGEARSPGRADLMRLAAAAGMQKSAAHEAIEQVQEAVVRWAEVADEYGVSATTRRIVAEGLEKVRQAFQRR